MQPLTGLTLPTEQQLQKERQEAAEESAHWYLYVYKVGWLTEGSRSKIYATLATLTVHLAQIRPCYKSYPHNW